MGSERSAANEKDRRALGTDGQKSELWVRLTECYRKINGRWLATPDHISVPVDLESGRAVLNIKT